MITIKTGSDITKVTSGLIIHGCNCLGVMGAGVAFALRKAHPSIFPPYIEMVEKAGERAPDLLGGVQFIKIKYGLCVANMMTQVTVGFRGKFADPAAIMDCLSMVAEYAMDNEDEFNLEIHSPFIGAGLGGLDWETEVYPLFEDINNQYPELKITLHQLEN